MQVALVPLHLDALRLQAPAQVAPPLIRPDRLPWSSGARDWNPEHPWLGASMDSAPFDADGPLLRPGVHLHWALPDGLTRGDGPGRFPAVPDRWLVRRHDGGGGAASAAWVVESDHVGRAETATAEDTLYPEPDAPEGRPPYSVQGRRMPLAQWRAGGPPPVRRAVTAIGHGDPKFAAFYPSCRGVFGLHDADAPAGGALRYELLGWHSRPDEDALDGFAPRADETMDEAVRRRFNWVLGDGMGPWRAARLVCYGTLTLDPPAATPPSGMVPGAAPTRAGTLDVAVGDSATEALGALAGQKTGDGAATERQVDALHLSDRVAHRGADHGHALADAVHERGFLAQTAGHRWLLVQAPSDGAAPEALTGGAPPRVAAALERANRAQAAWDRARAALDAARAQLFADWSKFAMLGAPQPGETPDFDRDQVLDYIRRGALAEVAQARAALGPDPLQQHNTQASSPAADDDSAGARLAAALADLRAELAPFNATRLSGRSLGAPSVEAGFVSFDGAGDALVLDRVEDWPGAPVLGGPGVPALHAVTVFLRVRIAALQAGTLLSFDAAQHFALQVDGAGHVLFVTAAEDGSPPDTLTSTQALQPGTWADIVAGYDADGVKRLWIDGAPEGAQTLAGAPSLGTGAVRRGVLGAEAATGGGWFAGDVARLIVRPGKAPGDADLAALRKRALPPPLTLEREADGRYWQPRDPVVLLAGDDVAATGRYERGPLLCHIVGDPDLAALGGSDRTATLRALAVLGRIVDALDDDDAGHAASDGAPWHPLFLDWESALHPYSARGPHAPGRSTYAPDYITADFELQPDGPGIRPRAGAVPVSNRVSLVSGRAILTPHAARRQADAQAWQAETGLATAPLAPAAAQAGDKAQSQALTGFHAALLQKRVGSGLRPDDPLAVGDLRDFSRGEVRAALGDGPVPAAAPNQPFLPIRAGRMTLRRLRLVDAFGQMRDVAAEAVARSADKVADAAGAVDLPPRLAQPARLSFRWRAAAQDGEASTHPDAHPVRGWLVANPLDTALALHAPDGTALGEVTEHPTRPWRTAPGRPAALLPEAFGTETLMRVAQALSSLEVAARAALLDAVSAALQTILPDVPHGPAALSLVAGRPLALVRARLRLELRDAPAIDQSWAALARDLTRDLARAAADPATGRHGRDDAGFTAVRFPVRLGAADRLDDGLVGFWREDADGLPTGPFHAPALPSGARLPGLVGAGDAGFALELTPGGPPVTVTMLLDPMGAVHATSDILPVKRIDLPDPHHADALARIESYSLAAPLLTPAGRMALPLRDIPGKHWRWLERTATGWQETGRDRLVPPRRDGVFEGRTEAREGWLVLAPTDPRGPTPPEDTP